MSPPGIFISHSHHDRIWCHNLVMALRERGYDTWIDRDGIPGGADWRQAIERELSTQAIFSWS